MLLLKSPQIHDLETGTEEFSIKQIETHSQEVKYEPFPLLYPEP